MPLINCLFASSGSLIRWLFSLTYNHNINWLATLTCSKSYEPQRICCTRAHACPMCSIHNCLSLPPLLDVEAAVQLGYHHRAVTVSSYVLHIATFCVCVCAVGSSGTARAPIPHLSHRHLLPVSVAAVEGIHIEPIERSDNCCITSWVEGAATEAARILIIAVIKSLQFLASCTVEHYLQYSTCAPLLVAAKQCSVEHNFKSVVPWMTVTDWIHNCMWHTLLLNV